MRGYYGGNCDVCRVSRTGNALKWAKLMTLHLVITLTCGKMSNSRRLSIPRNPVTATARDIPPMASFGEDEDLFLTFCVDFDGLPEQLASSRDYRVVAVTGCQCSGKSTLLNSLFGSM